MKKILFPLIIVMVTVFGVFTFTACEGNKKTSEQPITDTEAKIESDGSQGETVEKLTISKGTTYYGKVNDNDMYIQIVSNDKAIIMYGGYVQEGPVRELTGVTLSNYGEKAFEIGDYQKFVISVKNNAYILTIEEQTFSFKSVENTTLANGSYECTGEDCFLGLIKVSDEKSYWYDSYEGGAYNTTIYYLGDNIVYELTADYDGTFVVLKKSNNNYKAYSCDSDIDDLDDFVKLSATNSGFNINSNTKLYSSYIYSYIYGGASVIVDADIEFTINTDKTFTFKINVYDEDVNFNGKWYITKGNPVFVINTDEVAGDNREIIMDCFYLFEDNEQYYLEGGDDNFNSIIKFSDIKVSKMPIELGKTYSTEAAYFKMIDDTTIEYFSFDTKTLANAEIVLVADNVLQDQELDKAISIIDNDDYLCYIALKSGDINIYDLDFNKIEKLNSVDDNEFLAGSYNALGELNADENNLDTTKELSHMINLISSTNSGYYGSVKIDNGLREISANFEQFGDILVYSVPNSDGNGNIITEPKVTYRYVYLKKYTSTIEEYKNNNNLYLLVDGETKLLIEYTQNAN